MFCYRFACAFILAFSFKAAHAEERYIFEHVNVIDMTTEAVREDHFVVVEAGKIAAICAVRAKCAPGTAVSIKAQGKYLIPGLADMHTHLANFGLSGMADIASERKERVSRTLDQQLRQFPLFGVTTVRAMGGGRDNITGSFRSHGGETVWSTDICFLFPA